MEKGSFHSGLLKLMNLDLPRDQGEDGYVVGLIVLHAHWVSRFVLLWFLLAPLFNYVLHVKLVLLHPFLLLLYHLFSYFQQVWLLLFLLLQLSQVLLLFLVLLVLSFVLVFYRALVVLYFYVAQLLKVLHPLVEHTLSLTQFLHMDVQLVLIVLHFLNVPF